MKNHKANTRKLVARHTEHGLDKNRATEIGKISSLGTERNYRQCISNYLKWCNDNQAHPDFRGNKITLLQYLEERSEWVKQKTLNQERQALQLIFKQKLPYIKSLQESVYSKRSYTLSEVIKIIANQSLKNIITTWLAFFCGIRAHEAATLLPLSERHASRHRKWSVKRFFGLPTNLKYSVVGKGGLVREIAIPLWLATLLESRRRLPEKVIDREIVYFSHYDIGFGQAWSQSFSDASKKALGKSHGGHGLRHSYAKWRLQCLIDSLDAAHQSDTSNNPENEALQILSQELGHFRLDIVYCYLR